MCVVSMCVSRGVGDCVLRCGEVVHGAAVLIGVMFMLREYVGACCADVYHCRLVCGVVRLCCACCECLVCARCVRGCVLVCVCRCVCVLVCVGV